MAILIAQRACGANHEKKPASKAKGNETAAMASSMLLVASPTTMNTAIPPRPMKKAKTENAIPLPTPDLMCISPILSARFYMERANGWQPGYIVPEMAGPRLRHFARILFTPQKLPELKNLPENAQVPWMVAARFV